jgi:hypothetical protein
MFPCKGGSKTPLAPNPTQRKAWWTIPDVGVTRKGKHRAPASQPKQRLYSLEKTWEELGRGAGRGLAGREGKSQIDQAMQPQSLRQCNEPFNLSEPFDLSKPFNLRKLATCRWLCTAVSRTVEMLISPEASRPRWEGQCSGPRSLSCRPYR